MIMNLSNSSEAESYQIFDWWGCLTKCKKKKPKLEWY